MNEDLFSISPYLLLLIEVAAVLVYVRIRTEKILKKLGDQDKFTKAINKLETTLDTIKDEIKEGKKEHEVAQEKFLGVLNSVVKAADRLERKVDDK